MGRIFPSKNFRCRSFLNAYPFILEHHPRADQAFAPLPLIKVQAIISIYKVEVPGNEYKLNDHDVPHGLTN
jgi:hypothetical protein